MYSSTYQGLGFWAALATATAAAWSAYEGAQDAKACPTGYNKPVPPGTECPGTPDYDAVARAFSKATEGEIQAICTVLKATNDGRGPSSRSELLNPACLPRYVKAMMGGGDCTCSKIPEQCNMLADLVTRYGAPETEADLIPGSGAILHAATTPAGLGVLVAVGLAAFFLVPALKRGR